MADSNIKKFLDQAGVSTLWGEVAKKLTAEEARAKLAEKAAQDAADKANTSIGTLDDLSTKEKANLVGAINEVLQAVDTGGSGSVVTLEKSADGLTYTLKQGTNEVGSISIPKDMVVESGTVVTNPEDQPAGTYIKLVLANVAEPLYINVGTLVDLYTAEANATQIQLTINSDTRVISAKIVAGSVGTTELADGSVTTAKIADANVTLAKLSTELQNAIAKANSAIQTIETGTNNGTIKVDGNEVAVAGLKSAAYVESTAFDAAGSAAQALADAKTYVDAHAIALTEAEILQAIADAETPVA